MYTNKHSITFSLQCWLNMIFLAEPPSPNHHTVSAVPVDRRGAIRVSWTAPTVPSGELPITGYIIRYKVQNSSDNFRYENVIPKSESQVTGLDPGTVYRVYVAGVSAILIGRGSYCCEGTPVLVRTYNGKLHLDQGVDLLCVIRLLFTVFKFTILVFVLTSVLSVDFCPVIELGLCKSGQCSS